MSNIIGENDLYVMQIIQLKPSSNIVRHPSTGEYVRPNYENPNNVRYSFLTAEDYEVTYTFPMPQVDGYAGSYSSNIDGGNNAEGDYIGIVISTKINISGFSWVGLSEEVGRTLLQEFYGDKCYTFYARYFDPVKNGFVVRQFYRGDIEYEINNIVATQSGANTVLNVDYWKSIKIPVKEV